MFENVLLASVVLCVAGMSNELIKIKANHNQFEPWVVSSKSGENRCADDDPLGPCPSFIMLIENPLKRTVVVTLSCGLDLQKPEVVVPAKRRVTTEITSDAPGMLSCSIESWRSIKK